ncbi:MAG: ribosome biogenesis GTPase Der [Candidatus Zixiibacteriota bacterium]
MSLPTVAIIGRPNVGKSSLFNRLLQKRAAVVDEQPGITRDRNYAVCDWSGVQFCLVDTGGLVPETADLMEQLIFDQTEFAINESELVLFVVDAQVGLDPIDRRIADLLHRSKDTCLLVANKVDSEKYDSDVFEFMALGLGEPAPVSAQTGRGTGDLLDRLVVMLPEVLPEEPDETEVVKVAVVGRPNVGKSSFINCLIGQPRLLVTPVAGTTRDAIDTPFEWQGQRFLLIDTAGLRRRYKVLQNVEFYTNLRTIKAVENCHVAVLLVDAVDGLTSQDQRIMEQVLTARRGAVLAVNKWDLVEKETSTADRFTRAIRRVLAKYAHVPVVYMSALTGQRTTRVLALVKTVYGQYNKRIPTAELNDFLQATLARKHPPARRGKYIRIKYLTQTETGPPTFVFFANQPELVDKSYIAYLSNAIRGRFGFQGVPFRVKFRKK